MCKKTPCKLQYKIICNVERLQASTEQSKFSKHIIYDVCRKLQRRVQLSCLNFYKKHFNAKRGFSLQNTETTRLFVIQEIKGKLFSLKPSLKGTDNTRYAKFHRASNSFEKQPFNTFTQYHAMAGNKSGKYIS